MTTPSAGGPRGPGEGPEAIARRLDRWIIAHYGASERYTSYPEILEALKAYGDRRGEEERAKALGLDTPWPVTEVLRQLSEAATHMLRDHDCDMHGHEAVREARDAARRIIALAAAPSGDAKAAAPETVAEHLARMGSPAHSICSECPQPAGDAKVPAKPLVCPECGGRGWPTALDNCATCHGDPMPVGDAKGTK